MDIEEDVDEGRTTSNEEGDDSDSLQSADENGRGVKSKKKKNRKRMLSVS